MIRRIRQAAGALSFGLAAAVAAAIAAHLAIDALGDVALARDAYDGLAHDSRGLMALILLVGSTTLAIRFVLAALQGTAGRERVSNALYLPSAPVFVAAVIAGAAVVLVGMEMLDDAIATGSTGSIADALGGSVAFGLALVAGVAGVFGWSALAALRWFAQWHGDVLRAIVAVFSAGIFRDRTRTVGLFRPDVRMGRSALLLRRAAKRGPPVFLFA